MSSKIREKSRSICVFVCVFVDHRFLSGFHFVRWQSLWKRVQRCFEGEGIKRKVRRYLGAENGAGMRRGMLEESGRKKKWGVGMVILQGVTVCCVEIDCHAGTSCHAEAENRTKRQKKIARRVPDWNTYLHRCPDPDSIAREPVQSYGDTARATEAVYDGGGRYR